MLHFRVSATNVLKAAQKFCDLSQNIAWRCRLAPLSLQIIAYPLHRPDSTRANPLLLPSAKGWHGGPTLEQDCLPCATCVANPPKPACPCLPPSPCQLLSNYDGLPRHPVDCTMAYLLPITYPRAARLGRLHSHTPSRSLPSPWSALG